MLYVYTTLFFVLSSFLLSAQSGCIATIDEISRIGNGYRQSSTATLANLIFDPNVNDPVFDGDGSTGLFDLGFARGVWVGGLDPSGNVKVAASGYNSTGVDFVPGPIWNESQVDKEELCEFFRKVWTISEAELLQLQSLFASGNLSIGDISSDILEWPAKGNPHITNINIDSDLAPFFDNNSDGIYDPLQGDYPVPLDDSPDFIPEQFRFYVFNDQTVHGESLGDPLDMEFHVVDYVIDASGNSESATSVFTRLKSINKSLEELRDFRIGIWDDTDLGCFFDDFIGCDTTLNASYVYNTSGSDFDDCAPYQSVPNDYGVVRSLVFLNRDLEKYIHFFNCSIVDFDPEQCPPKFGAQYYFSLNGLWLDGSSITTGGTGFNPNNSQEASHVFPDFPNNPDGWSMETAGLPYLDTRSLSVFGEEAVVLPGQIGVVDYVDHLLISQEKTGLDIFELYETSINGIKQEFETEILGTVSSTQDDLKRSPLFSLYPNPASEVIDIKLSALITGKVQVHTIEGTLIATHLLSSSSTINLPVADYSPGIYVVTLQASDGTVSTARFVKL